MEESALKLIRASCNTQSLHDAISSTFKDRKFVSAVQAELDDKLEEMQKQASWVDITVGMEASEQREYKTECSSMIKLLNPSDPRALNFADKQCVKTFLSKAADTDTVGVQESLGDTEFMPADDDIDSQESDLFGGYENNGFVEDPFHDKDGGIIANMDLLKGDGPNNTVDAAEAGDDEDMDDVGDEGELGKGAASISSPKKINWKATNFDEIPNKPSVGQQEVIHTMLREWAETHGTKEPLPPVLRSLANQIGVSTAQAEPNPSTPGRPRRGQREKPISPSKVIPPCSKLDVQRFVLTGTWPGLGGEGLTAGKEAVKAGIEKHGGKVTSGFSNITNFLVIGTSPGPKKILNVNHKGIQIVTLDQVNSVIVNDDMAIEDLAGPYPDAAMAILAELGIQVQRLLPPPDLQEQSAVSTSMDSVVQGQVAGPGVGHRNA
jgi:hypothetical protein